MDADLYVTILQQGLLPFIRDTYPASHRLMQDNDPKHTSRAARNFFEQEHIHWWKTPPESPDLNPIENFWHELTFAEKSNPLINQSLLEELKDFGIQ
jgi:transposase